MAKTMKELFGTELTDIRVMFSSGQMSEITEVKAWNECENILTLKTKENETVTINKDNINCMAIKPHKVNEATLYKPVTLRAKALQRNFEKDIPVEVLREELLRQLAKGILPYVTFTKRDCSEFDSVEHYAEIKILSEQEAADNGNN